MAELTNSILGDINGKLGNEVIRKMNGKQFMSKRPPTYQKTKSPKAISVRGFFGFTSKFASHLNKISEITQIWSKVKMDAKAPYHRVISYNAGLSEDNKPVPLIEKQIVPVGLEAQIVKIKLNKNNISLKFDLKKILNSNPNFKSLSLFVLFFFYDAVENNTEPAIFEHISSKGIKISEINNGLFTLKFTGSFKQQFTRYNKIITYSTIIFDGNNLQDIYWTSTNSMQFDLK